MESQHLGSGAPTLLTIEAATREIGISRSTFYREMDAGRIGVIHVRSRPYVTRPAVEAYIEQRMAEATQ